MAEWISVKERMPAPRQRRLSGVAGMAKAGKGGMQTAGLHYSIYCPKCGKPAVRREETADGARYLHFAKNGSVWHESPQREEGQE